MNVERFFCVHFFGRFIPSFLLYLLVNSNFPTKISKTFLSLISLSYIELINTFPSTKNHMHIELWHICPMDLDNWLSVERHLEHMWKYELCAVLCFVYWPMFSQFFFFFLRCLRILLSFFSLIKFHFSLILCEMLPRKP